MMSVPVTFQERLAEAVRRSEPYMPAELWRQVKALLDPKALAIMATVTGAWAVSHFFGVGEIVDVVLLAAGGAVLGISSVAIARDALSFARTVREARSDEDLDRAARLFASVVVNGGIALLSAMLFKTRPKAFHEPFFAEARPLPPPRTPGLFYKPSVRYNLLRPGLKGATTDYGDIVISTAIPEWAQQEALLHEKVHQLLTPKLYFLREIRVKASIQGYSRSYILRYLEEGLAQTYALVKSRGPGFAIEGLRFPVKNGYVTVAGLLGEARGILLGPVNVGATAYRVMFEGN